MSTIAGLTQLEKDTLSLDSRTVAEKYQTTRDGVYARKYTLQKRIKEHKLTEAAALKLPTIKESVLIKSSFGGRKAAGDGLPNAAPPNPHPHHPAAASHHKPAKKVEVRTKDDLDKLFLIEETPPPLPMSAESAKQAALARIEHIGRECPAGGAIVIPSRFKGAAMSLLNEKIPTAKWKTTPILGNATAVRIYKLNP